MTCRRAVVWAVPEGRQETAPMTEPSTSGDSEAAENPVNSDVDPVKEKDKAPDAAQAAQPEVEDWKIQAELFKTQGRMRIGKQYLQHT